MYKRIRDKYEARLDALCEFIEDIVSVNIRVHYKRRKLRLFDVVVNSQGRKPSKRGKLKANAAVWLCMPSFYQNYR